MTQVYSDPTRDYNIGVPFRENHQGTLLTRIDPRAWAGSMAFPGTTLENPPSKRDVYLHVIECDRREAELRAENPRLYDRVSRPSKIPVLWSFGKVYWTRCEDIVPL